MPFMPVAGSEVFSSRIRTREQLAQGIPDTLFMHEATPAAVEGIDALSYEVCLLYTSPSPRDKRQSRMPSSA